MSPQVPSARRPTGPAGWADRVRDWYENELGWATVPATAPGEPVRLVTGLRFDVLDIPAEAGRAALHRLGPDSPVALQGDRMRLLVAAGSAEELPGLLDWLEWGPLAPELDLVPLGPGGHVDAPLPPGASSLQGAAVWLRPPWPGCEVESSLPALPTVPALGDEGGTPDLVRLVNTVATQCHRVRLRRACARPPACAQTQPPAAVPRTPRTPAVVPQTQPLAFS